MFEQHPVPQQISSYQFRLVGDMTLKQFFQIAAGCIVGLIIYSTTLPAIIKWPLIIIFVIAGAAFAFLPLQERPLEEWFAAFFRAIYGPTLFVWEKPSTPQEYFAKANLPGATPLPQGQIPGATAVQETSVAKMEEKENSFLSTVTNMFSLHPAKQPTQGVAVPQPASPPPPPVPQVQPDLISRPLEIPQAQPKPTQIVDRAAESARLVTQQIVTDKPNTPLPAQPPRPGTLFVATPQAPRIATERTGFSQATTHSASSPLSATGVAPSFSGQGTGAMAQSAQFSQDAAPPITPTVPNLLTGQIMDNGGKILEGAIIEVKDFQGRPVRAFRSNKAGHFMIVTPLPNGAYTLNVEKEGYGFEPVKIEVHGALVPPVAIRSKAQPENKNTTQ